MKQNTKFGTIILVLAALSLLLIACGQDPQIKFEDNTSLEGGELKKFSSQKELNEYVKNTAQFSGGINSGIRTLKIASDAAMPMAESSTLGGAGDYSQTNVQVAGVDEADFVKNDGKYIYVITQDKLVIADAFPAEKASILSKTEIVGNPRNLLLNGDKLIIFSEGYDEIYAVSRYDFVPRPVPTPVTHILVYDVSDRKKPKLVKDYTSKGYYHESRMIGNHVYFIVQENVYYGDVIPMPRIMESSKIIMSPDVYYFDNPEDSYNFNTIGSLSLENNELNAQTFMMGYSSTIYVSENNIYIAYQKSMPYRYYETQNDERFFKAVLPLFSTDTQTEILAIKNDESLDNNEMWDQITAALEESYNKMSEQEKKNMVEDIEKNLEEYDFNLQKEQSKTIIHRIAIDQGAISYVGRGEVDGRLLNQFSLDEFEGNLRVATTTELWARESIMYNNVYVLDSSMAIKGKLENLANDERIYSTRFIGTKLYMVTFKRIDPLFVIDLSNPEKPEVLGELKIPGFSDYLHPYDENHIIGIGKETEGNEWGGVSVKGVKIALFDVSDVKNPKQLWQREIGEAGTDSEALRDHKAFLFDREKNLLVLPVTEVTGKIYDPRYGGYYRQNYWQGAYVFSISPESLELKGKISHGEGEESDYYYYGGPSAVKRALFMDETLYTISLVTIKMHDLGNVTEVNELELPYKDYYYDSPMPVDVKSGSVSGSSGIGQTTSSSPQSMPEPME